MQRTLTGELTFWLVVSISVIVIGLGAGFIWRTYYTLIAEANHEAEVICADLALILREPMWNYRHDRVEEVADVFMASRAVDGIRVYTDKEVIHTVRPQDRVNVLENTQKIFFNDRELGEVTVWVLKDRIYVRLNRLAALVFWVGSAMILVVILMTRLIMNRLLKSPMLLLLNQLDMIAAGRYERPVVKFKQDDIRSILEQVNTIAMKIEKQQFAIRESEAKYRHIVESSPIGISQTTEDGRFITINPALARMFGYEHPQQMSASVGSTLQLYMDIRHREEMLARLKTEGRILDFEVKLRHRQGKAIWAALNLRAARDPNDGSIALIEGFVQDITARKAAEENLKAANDRLEKIVRERTAELSAANSRLWALLGASPDPIAIFNTQGDIDYINPAFTKTFGWHIEELKGQTIKFVPDNRIEETRQTIKTLYSGQSIAQLETMRITKDGQLLPVDVSASVFPDHINPEGMVVILRNMTERKAAEEELKRAKEAAEAATLAKSNFLANMSHEIRTPLNGVIAAASYIINQDMSEEVEKFIKIIYASGLSLMGIINDVLDFSKIEAQKVKLDCRPFHLMQDVILEIMGVMNYKALERGIELGFDIDCALPKYLIGDPLRIKQVLNNLVGNAIKFTQENGFVFVAMEPLRLEQDSVTILCSVKDNGTGIEPAKLSGLFQPFTQADNSIRRKHGGTGLGLSISKRLIKLMGGWLWAVSTPGKGSTFFFTFYVEQQQGVSETIPVIPANIQGLRVLVVADRVESGLIIHKLLTSFGYQAEIASSQTAIAKLGSINSGTASSPAQSPGFDLIIADCYTCESEGLETVRLIRQEIHSSTPIILTGTFKRNCQHNIPRWINVFLPKPVDESSLLNAVMSVFGQNPLKFDKPTFGSNLNLFRQRLAGMRIMLVEDNETNREIAIAILSSVNIQVLPVDNGKAAVDLLQNNSNAVDVILMDIQMPVMDGMEATRVIREELGLLDLPVIAMTAHAMDRDREKCLAAGMNGYVSKPINQENLFSALWKIWKTHHKPIPIPDNQNSEVIPQDHSPAFMFSAPGLDLQNASGLSGLPSQIISKILQGFSRSQANIDQLMYEAWHNGDKKTFERLTHNLKGAAGNIGASALAEAARHIETAAEQGIITETLWLNIRNSLAETFHAIEHWIKQYNQTESIPESTAPHDPARLKTLLATLTKALQNADPVTAEIELENIKQLYPAQAFNQLEELIQEYKYDEALKKIWNMGK